MNIAIYGYGNLGKGVEVALKNYNDITLFGIFTRRDKNSIKTITNAKVYNSSDLYLYKDKIDILIICAGSATELPNLSPTLAKDFNIIDSFDNHADILTHYKKINKSCIENNRIALISSGWDPGLLSLFRLYSKAVLPFSKIHTFWGKGISQGHSNAVKKIDGVLDCIQYTIPIKKSIYKARKDCNINLSNKQKHLRKCYVVAKNGANKAEICKKIKFMPNYFVDYNTIVKFVSQNTINKMRKNLPHGATLITSGNTGLYNENKHIIEYNLKLDSNPEFTGNILLASARALYKMKNKGETGCKTIFDLTPSDFLDLSKDEIIKKFL